MKSFALAALVGLAAANSNEDDFAGIFPDSDQWKTGLVDISAKDDIFYWTFESRGNPATDPLVLWLTGGPGCASEVALFFENGPYKFEEDASVGVNPHSWNTNANLLYVD